MELEEALGRFTDEIDSQLEQGPVPKDALIAVLNVLNYQHYLEKRHEQLHPHRPIQLTALSRPDLLRDTQEHIIEELELGDQQREAVDFLIRNGFLQDEQSFYQLETGVTSYLEARRAKDDIRVETRADFYKLRELRERIGDRLIFTGKFEAKRWGSEHVERAALGAAREVLASLLEDSPYNHEGIDLTLTGLTEELEASLPWNDENAEYFRDRDLKSINAHLPIKGLERVIAVWDRKYTDGLDHTMQSFKVAYSAARHRAQLWPKPLYVQRKVREADKEVEEIFRDWMLKGSE